MARIAFCMYKKCDQFSITTGLFLVAEIKGCLGPKLNKFLFLLAFLENVGFCWWIGNAHKEPNQRIGKRKFTEHPPIHYFVVTWKNLVLAVSMALDKPLPGREEWKKCKQALLLFLATNLPRL